MLSREVQEPMSSAGSDLRVAVVGTGTMGLDHVRRLTARTKGARVSAVVEPDQRRAESALALTGGAARWFASLPDAIESGAADAVLVASPGVAHEEALHQVLAAGLPTLCEKPLTMTTEAARRIVQHELILEKPLIQVGFHRRYDSGYRWLHELVRSGDSGDLLALHCRHRNPSLPPGWDDAMLVEDAAAHEMDIVAWLAGDPIVSVEVHKARANRLTPNGVHDPILLLMKTATGVLADVEINMNFQAAYQVSTEAVFEQGLAETGRPFTGERVVDGRAFQDVDRTYVTRFVDAYDAEIQDWVNAVSGSQDLRGATAWDGYRAVMLCEAGLEAQRTGTRIEVPDEQAPEFYRIGGSR